MKINLQCDSKLNSKYKTTIIPIIERENLLTYLKKFLNLQESKSNKKMINDLEKQLKPTNNLSTSLFIELKGETYHLLISTIDFKEEEASNLKSLIKASNKKDSKKDSKKDKASKESSYEFSSKIKTEDFGAVLDHVRNRGAETYKECQSNKLVASNLAMISHYHDKMNGLMNIAFLEGFLLAMYSFDKYKTSKSSDKSSDKSSKSSKREEKDKEQEQEHKLKDLHLVFPDNDASKIKEIDQETKNLLIKIKSVYLARDLSNEPGSSLSPKNFIDTIKGFVSFHKVPVSIEVINTTQLKKMGMSLMVSVGNGSRPDYQSHFLIIKYFPNSITKSNSSNKSNTKKSSKKSKKRTKNENNNNQEGGKKTKKTKKSTDDTSSKKSIENPDYVLLGKGVTFDTGGISLKRSKDLHEMKSDMSGAAVVSSFILGHAKTNGKESVIALVPLAENNIGPGATLPGDVIKSYSGKTVEILNTDAEGRLLLADALSYAEEKYPNAKMIDLATLTGAQDNFSCGQFSNVMTRHTDFAKDIKESGDFIQEKMVETPYMPKFEKYLESHVADVANVARKCSSGLITSGIFLSQFVSKDVIWAHLDIAGPAWKQTIKKYNQKEASGVGVRFLFDLIN